MARIAGVNIPQNKLVHVGYSDIEKKRVDYKIDQIYDEERIKSPEHEIIGSVIQYGNNMENNSSYRLRLYLSDKDLPKISIVTPTRNRKDLFQIWIDNYKRIDYPSNKIEFIIVDDGEENLKDILPKDKIFDDITSRHVNAYY